jgi:AmmeMemoRadiSam system protein B
MLRKPVVSGQFYPANKEALASLIDSFLPKTAKKMSARAIILPHAGYIYSGKVAVETVSRIMPAKRLVILGPKHSSGGEDFALWAKGGWITPFGEIKIDQDLASRILAKGNYIKEDYLAHQPEHSIEVELPILTRLFGVFEFVPIACQVSTLEIYQSVARELYEAIKPIKEQVLLIASSDMTHYSPDEICRRKDRAALDSIIALDLEALIEKVIKEDISMCGIAPVVILISCLKHLGAKKAQIALYQTSGDINADYSSVVGYAGVIFS